MDSWCNRSKEGSTVKNIAKDGALTGQKKIHSGLVYLAQKGQLKKLQRLLPRTHVHEMDEHGACALHQASREGHVDVMKHLLAKGADVNAPGELGRTPLMYAAECKTTREPLAVLLASGARVNDVDAVLGASALDLAAQFGSFEAVELLLRHGANPMQRDRHGMLPLHRGAQHGAMETLKVLLERTDNVKRSLRQNSTRTVNIKISSENNKPANRPTLHLAETGSAGSTRSHANPSKTECHQINKITTKTASASNDQPKTKIMVNIPSTKNNATPLHCAAAGGKADNVLFLLTHGAFIDGQMRDGSTALHVSAGTGTQTVAEVLSDKGAGINLQKQGGFTPLATACAVGDLSMSALLLENGADARVRGDNGWSPLHFAAFRGDMELVRQLLPHSDCNATTNQGDNMLLLAIKHNHQDLVTLLPSLCDVSHVDKRGNTALHYAAETGNAALIRPLLKHGAEVVVRNVNGETPIQVAADRGHGSVVKDLLQHDKELAQEFLDLNKAKYINGETEKQTKVDSKDQKKSRDVFDGVFDRVSDIDVIKFVLHHQDVYTKL